MQLPLQITFRDFPPSDAISAKIQQQVDKLHRFYDRITSCQVVVEAPHNSHRRGRIYHVKINLTVPQGTLSVGRDSDRDRSHENPYVAIRDAFAAAKRQLKRYAYDRRH